MRPDALRPGTAKAAVQAKRKLKTRLSKGEKSARKRMAEVAAVYDVTPVVRAPSDIIGRDDDGPRPEAPKARNKWLNASVVDDAAAVIRAAFDEATRRDPAHERTWIALVDGARHQIDRIRAEAKAQDIEVAIVCDFVDVMDVPCPHCAPIFPRWSLGPFDGKNPCRCWVSAADVPCRRRRRWYLDRVTAWPGRHRPGSRLGGGLPPGGPTLV
jgi:hypothetical protein